MGEPSTFFGTAFQVAGTWYVRHEGGRGVLLPITAEKEVFVTLTDQQAYEFEGKVEADYRGCAVSARVKHANAIGNNVANRV